MEVSYKRLWGLFTNENMKKSLHPIKIGILPEVLEIYFKKMECGITLILLDKMYRKYMEPGAATYVNCLAPLWRLHDKGCKTYVYVHPYPLINFINQDLGKRLEDISFGDKIIFGRKTLKR